MAHTATDMAKAPSMTIAEALWLACSRAKLQPKGQCHACSQTLLEARHFCDEACEARHEAIQRKAWAQRHPTF